MAMKERKTKPQPKLPKEVKPATLAELEGRLAGAEQRNEQLVRAVTEAVRSLSYHSADHGSEEAKKIVRKMMRWVPEMVPEETIEAMKANEHWYEPGNEKNPFFGSQSWIYPLLGKEDARTFFAYFHGLLKAIGMNPDSFENDRHHEWRDTDEYSEKTAEYIEEQVEKHKKLLRGELVPEKEYGYGRYNNPKPCTGTPVPPVKHDRRYIVEAALDARFGHQIYQKVSFERASKFLKTFYGDLLSDEEIISYCAYATRRRYEDE
jgi:hypothetical protein